MTRDEYRITPLEEIAAIERAYLETINEKRSWDAYMMANIFGLFGVKKKTTDFLPKAAVSKKQSQEDKRARLATLAMVLRARGYGHKIENN